jgi:hypothetical protein
MIQLRVLIAGLASSMTEGFCVKLLPLMLLCGLFCTLPANCAQAAADVSPAMTASAGGAQLSSEAVMQQFAGDDEEAPERRIDTKRKHQILFIMGI